MKLHYTNWSKDPWEKVGRNTIHCKVDVNDIMTFETGQSKRKINSIRKAIQEDKELPPVRVLERTLFMPKQYKYVVTDGHHRLAALKQEGITHIDVVYEPLPIHSGGMNA